jgi:hypothetical protein
VCAERGRKKQIKEYTKWVKERQQESMDKNQEGKKVQENRERIK